MSKFEIDETKPASRFDYIKYDEFAIRGQEKAKALCQNLEEAIEHLPVSRAKAVAITKLEECYMWIGKGIRDEQIARNTVPNALEEKKDG